MPIDVLRARGLMAVLTAAPLLACAAPVAAQTITDGNSSFTMADVNTTGAGVRTGTTGGSGTAVVFTAGGDTTDQLFQQWWWFRVNGLNIREFALSGRTSTVATGNTHTLEYTEPDGFRARIVYKITDGPDAPAAANVAGALTITNTGAAPLDIAVFAYTDFDIEGVSGDSATLAAPGRMRITETTGFFGEFLAINPAAYEVTAFSTVRGKLADSDIDNLANTGLPFGAGDFTGAYQWNPVIAAGGSATFRIALSLNMEARAGCAGDFNGDGAATVQDIFDFLLAYFSNAAAADVNGVDGVTVQDIFDYLIAYFAGCA